jgi:microcystin-dependent protein
MHAGNGPGLTNRQLGLRSGSESTTLTSSNLPAHSHSVQVSPDVGDQTSPVGNIPAVPNDGESNFVDPDPVNSSPPSITTNSTGSTGANQSFSHMPPYLAVNFCIALTGLFPSRS